MELYDDGFLSLQMQGEKSLFEAFGSLAAKRWVLHHISLQVRKNTEVNHFHDYMTPSLFQKMEAPIFKQKIYPLFFEKRWSHMNMEIFILFIILSSRTIWTAYMLNKALCVCLCRRYYYSSLITKRIFYVGKHASCFRRFPWNVTYPT